jgi:hypothetical protein
MIRHGPFGVHPRYIFTMISLVPLPIGFGFTIK